MTGEGKSSGNQEPEEFDAAAFEEAFAAEFGETVEPDRQIDDTPATDAEDEGETRRVLAVVLTPIASAQVLAALCSMAEIDADIIPSKRGALAAKVITTSGDLDPGELLSGAPSGATELATTLSGTTKLGVVLLTARLGAGEEGVTGTISARSFDNGTEGEEVAPGLILAQSDDVVEQILIGSLAPADAKGRLVPTEMSRWQAARVMAKQMKRRKP